MHTRFAYNAISVAGRRPENEDAWGAHRYGETLFCAVADGIGGRPAGEVASACAVQTAEDVVSQAFIAGNIYNDPALLREAHACSHAAVKQEATGPKFGMGTTLTTALFRRDRLTTCNTGDSRCSLVRDGQLIPITHDHSLVQEQIDAGIIHPEDAFGHPLKHIITRSIGGNFEADVTEIPIKPGDTVILSTDGMHDYLTPDAIVSSVQGKYAGPAAAALLTKAAPTSRDNITICIVTVS